MSSTLDQIAALDQIHVQQKLTPMVNVYEISAVGPDGKSAAGQPLARVQQKRLALREQINFFSREGDKEHILRLQAKSRLDARGRAEVQLADGTVIGMLQKMFQRSLFRSTWEILDASGSAVATVHESNVTIAVLRRIWGFVPILGEVPFLLPFHFDIEIAGRTVGTYRRLYSLRDSYLLDLRGDTERRIDRRVAMGLAVALDALQGR